MPALKRRLCSGSILEVVQLNASSSTFRALYISGRGFYGLDGVWQMH